MGAGVAIFFIDFFIIFDFIIECGLGLAFALVMGLGAMLIAGIGEAMVGAGGVVGVPLDPLVVIGTFDVPGFGAGVVCASAGRESASTATAAVANAKRFFIE